ncbi:MAG: hypothetical protein WCL02_06810 [bacterium]
MPFFLPTQKENQESEINIYTPKNERLKAISDFSLVLEKSTNKNESFS